MSGLNKVLGIGRKIPKSVRFNQTNPEHINIDIFTCVCYNMCIKNYMGLSISVNVCIHTCNGLMKSVSKKSITNSLTYISHLIQMFGRYKLKIHIKSNNEINTSIQMKLYKKVLC